MCLPDGFGQNLPNLIELHILSDNNQVNILQQIKETLFNRSRLQTTLRLECGYARLIYKKILKIINKDLYNPYTRIYTEYAYKPPHGLVPNRLMKEDVLVD